MPTKASAGSELGLLLVKNKQTNKPFYVDKLSVVISQQQHDLTKRCTCKTQSYRPSTELTILTSKIVSNTSLFANVF